MAHYQTRRIAGYAYYSFSYHFNTLLAQSKTEVKGSPLRISRKKYPYHLNIFAHTLPPIVKTWWTPLKFSHIMLLKMRLPSISFRLGSCREKWQLSIFAADGYGHDGAVQTEYITFSPKYMYSVRGVCYNPGADHICDEQLSDVWPHCQWSWLNIWFK